VIAGEIDRAIASFAPLARFFQARTGDLPIEIPTHFELAIIFRTAKALGLALARVDEVIE
jgi:hypothetical protein